MTGLKCVNAEIKFLPRQVFPEGLMSSCRADMSNTLAQNGHCELLSGVYQSAKTHPTER